MIIMGPTIAILAGSAHPLFPSSSSSRSAPSTVRALSPSPSSSCSSFEVIERPITPPPPSLPSLTFSPLFSDEEGGTGDKAINSNTTTNSNSNSNNLHHNHNTNTNSNNNSNNSSRSNSVNHSINNIMSAPSSPPTQPQSSSSSPSSFPPSYSVSQSSNHPTAPSIFSIGNKHSSLNSFKGSKHSPFGSNKHSSMGNTKHASTSSNGFGNSKNHFPSINGGNSSQGSSLPRNFRNSQLPDGLVPQRQAPPPPRPSTSSNKSLSLQMSSGSAPQSPASSYGSSPASPLAERDMTHAHQRVPPPKKGPPPPQKPSRQNEHRMNSPQDSLRSNHSDSSINHSAHSSPKSSYGRSHQHYDSSEYTSNRSTFKGVFSNLVSSMSDLLSSDKKMEISSPYNPVHLTHVGYNLDTGEFTGLPKEWQQLLQESGISKQDQAANPQAVIDIIGFYTDSQEGKQNDAVWKKFGHNPQESKSSSSSVSSKQSQKDDRVVRDKPSSPIATSPSRQGYDNSP
ncbi:signal transducing kinase of the PAK, partial [Entomortierella lignicola]